MPWFDSEQLINETEERLKTFRQQELTYGISFLDKATDGITTADLALVGAPSGMGKTGFVTNLAFKNVLNGKRVHLIALEAYKGEIQDRIQYQKYAELFYKDPNRVPNLDMSFRNWRKGRLDFALAKYKPQVKEFVKILKNLKTYYHSKEFTVDDFVRNAMIVEHETDLIIVDHVHYFDIADENENRGMKALIKEIRNIQATINKPVVVVAHLRKKDRTNPVLCAGMDEFMGSSDLVKIATQVITLGKGEMVTPSSAETYVRVPKNRWDGSVTFYCAKMRFNFRRNEYEDEIAIGKLTKGDTRWEPIPDDQIPQWMKEQSTPTRPVQSFNGSPVKKTGTCSQNQATWKF